MVEKERENDIKIRIIKEIKVRIGQNKQAKTIVNTIKFKIKQIETNQRL